jgi:hypothetical protein
LRVCLAHLGGALPFLRERIAIGFPRGARALRRRSDAPFAIGDLARSVESIRSLTALPARDRARILGANAEAFLKGPAASPIAKE